MVQFEEAFQKYDGYKYDGYMEDYKSMIGEELYSSTRL